MVMDLLVYLRVVILLVVEALCDGPYKFEFDNTFIEIFNDLAYIMLALKALELMRIFLTCDKPLG